MSGRVTVAEQIYDQQGVKYVLSSDGRVRTVPPGQRPEPTEEILGREGEPAFQVRLANELSSDDDLPDEVGLALRRVAQRLSCVTLDGREVPEEQGVVEWTVGPAVHDGVLMICLDTDGMGFSRTVVDTMVDIFVEELTPLGIQADISAAPVRALDFNHVWMSSTERRTR